MEQFLETVIADTLFEAQQLARQKYGDDVEYVSDELIDESKLFGFSHKDRVKLVYKRKSSGQPSNSAPPGYRLPNIQQPGLDNSLRETAISYEPRKPLSVPQRVASSIYKKTQQLDRDVDGIRSLQEGDDEPHSQKAKTDDYSNKAMEMQSLIDVIKKKRSSENAMTRELKFNEKNSQKLDSIFDQMGTICEFIKTLSANSSNFLYGNKSLPQGLADIEKELLEIETPQEVIDSLFRDLRMSCSEETLVNSKETLKALHKLIKSRLTISSDFEIKKGSNPQVIVLMGPTGVGKTTTLAKLAAKYCLNAQKPIKSSIINIDFYKLGASAQLKTYADIFGIDVEDVTSIASLDFLLNSHKDDDLIIVDTAGRSQYAIDELKELKSYVDRIPNATKYLTISSTSKYSDLKAIVNSFGNVGFDHIILTKTDETSTLGPAVGMLLQTKKSVAYITHGQQVPEDYSVADFKFFEEKIFQHRPYEQI